MQNEMEFWFLGCLTAHFFRVNEKPARWWPTNVYRAETHVTKTALAENHREPMKPSFFSLILLLITHCADAQPSGQYTLANDRIRLVWQPSAAGYQLREVSIKRARMWVPLANPSGEHTLLYSIEKPKSTPDTLFRSVAGEAFPGPAYKYQTQQWAEVTNSVALNRAGQALHFFPKSAIRTGPTTVSARNDSGYPCYRVVAGPDVSDRRAGNADAHGQTARLFLDHHAHAGCCF